MRRIGWIVSRAVTSQKAARDPVAQGALQKLQQDLLAWVDEFPHSFRRGASPLAFVPNLEEFLAVAIENNRYGPYWVRKGGLNTKDFWDSYADVPVLWQGGWYDIMPKQITEQYVRAVRKNRSPQKLLMGPWTHGDPRSYSGDAEFGLEAAVDFDMIGLRWFDQFLKGVDTGCWRSRPSASSSWGPSAIDTDVAVKVLDVYPPSRDWPEGFEMNLSDIIMRAAYREPEQDPVPLRAGCTSSPSRSRR